MKKIFCVVFIIALLSSTIAATAQANPDDLYHEMYVLQDNGIIKGDPSGGLRPDDELTRAEFAAILCRAIGVDKIAETPEMAGKDYFGDVPSTHWAAGYINTAVEFKAINGFDDGTFRPALTITNEQAVKILVAAWGYTDEAKKLGGYPNGYMEVAKRYGVTDAVLFNYGIASKRWVACAFVYGALSMPADKSAAIDISFDIDPIKTQQARPENTGYVDDPVSILKRITPASAKYERTVFEQSMSADNIPFTLQGNTLIFNGQAGDRKIKLNVSDSVNKEPLADGFFKDNSYHLSDLAAGTWRCQLQITDGAVRDTYFSTLEREDSGRLRFSGDVYRYTTLNARPVITEVRQELSFTNTQSSEFNPFLFEPVTDDNKNPALRVSYPLVLEEGFRLDLSVNTDDASRELYALPMHIEGVQYQVTAPIMGKNALMKPVVISKLEVGVNYHIQVSVDNGYGDDVVLKGSMNFFENSGKLDYRFNGTVRTLSIDGYEIKDYTYEA